MAEQKKSAEVAIKVENVSKSFKLPHEKQSSVKSLFINVFRRKKFTKQQALKDINFEVKKGEFFGIVGRNGSGKSTLLKLLAGIYTPDSGSIVVNGKLTPFIELGVGFNPELTGRENVFLNGALLGFNRKEVDAMYNEIVDFAELHKFMDQKLKNYSSGMQVRLAFSIAIKSKSEILIFDEVLAVGDTSFQRKCFDIFDHYKANKKTVILVTHDMGSVRQFCDKAMLISNSKIVASGNPSQIASEYEKINQQVIDRETKKQNTSVSSKSFIKAKIRDRNNKDRASFTSDEPICINITWPKSKKIKNLGVAIIKESGEYIFGANTFEYGAKKPIGKNSFVYEINQSLGTGRYRVIIGAFGSTEREEIGFLTQGPSFVIVKKGSANWEGMVYIPHKWK